MYPLLLHAGHLTLPTFGLLAAVGLVCALALSQYTASMAGANPDQLWNAGLFAVIAAFVLSRLILLTQHLQSFARFPVLLLTVPSLTATGLLLTVLATFLWMRLKRVRLLPALDAWAPCATLVWGFLALGHFAEGSDPGAPTSLPFGVHMPGDPVAQHPVALYVALTAFILTALLLVMLQRSSVAGDTASIALISSGTAQFVLSFVRLPGEATVAGLDALQLAAFGLIMAGCLLFFAPSHDAPQQSTAD